MFNAPDRDAFDQRRSQLFSQLAGQGSLRRLAFFYFSAGKFPLHRRRIALTALTDQQPPVRTLDYRRSYNSHFSASLRILRASALSSYRFALLCSNFHNSSAPLASGGPGVFNNSSRTTYTRFSRTAGTSCQAATP